MIKARKRKAGRSPVLFVIFLILLLWLPLPFGSNDIAYWAFMEACVYIVSAIWLFNYARGRVKPTTAFLKTKPILILLGLWLTYGLFQMIPLPHNVVAFLSPNAAQLYDKAYQGPALARISLISESSVSDSKPSVAGGENSQTPTPDTERLATQHDTNASNVKYHPLTLDISASLGEWLKSLAYVLFFVLALLLVDSHKRLRILANVLIISGLVQAVYGSLMLAQTGETVATGTFVNRNHYAAYLVLCLSIGIGLLIASMEGLGQHNVSWRSRIRHLAQLVMSPKAPLRIFLAIMVIAVVLTHSRMGNVSFFASMLIAGMLALVLYKKSPRPTVILITSLIVFDIVIIGSYVGIEQVKERLEKTTLESEARDEIDKYSIEMIKDYPVVGAGAGSFYGVFPQYSGADVSDLYWDRAHNDYLEMLSEFGFLGTVLLGTVVALSLGSALIAQRKRNSPLMRGIGFAATMGITAMLIHASVEFNLHIPAYAGTFMVLLAMAWLVRYVESRTPSDLRNHGEEKPI